MARIRNIDRAWDALNEYYGILEHIDSESKFELRSEQIHALRGVYPSIKFEPRLLAHFDNRSQQPKFFQQNELSILPIERGSWVIGRFSPFMKIGLNPEEIETKVVPSRASLETLSPCFLTNESMGLNFAYVHGVIADFCGQEVLPTVSGRHSGGSWEYKIISGDEVMELNAQNPQIEVDAGFEGENLVVLVEAKNELVEEFCLRQLYFPFRAWRSKVSKPVETIFAAFSGSDVYLYEYEFPVGDVFNAELVRACRYVVDDGVLEADAISALWMESSVEEEPENIPFPQANSPLRTIDVVEHLADKFMNECRIVDKDELAERYGFRDRQSDYYANTAAYFGFLNRSNLINGPFVPTDRGLHFAELPDKKSKYMELCAAVFRRSIFHDAYGFYIQNGEIPSVQYIEKLMESVFPSMSHSTVHRRASGVRAWIQWISNLPTLI